MSEQLLITLGSTVFSGILGVIVTIYIQKKEENRRKKFLVFQQLMGYRYDIQSAEFISALNQIVVVFHDSQEVILSIKKFYESLGTSMSDQRLLELFKAVMNELQMDVSVLNDTFFMKPFQISKYSD